MRTRLFIIFLLTLPLSIALPATAQNGNEEKAKPIFKKAYNMWRPAGLLLSLLPI